MPVEDADVQTIEFEMWNTFDSYCVLFRDRNGKDLGYSYIFVISRDG